MYAFYDCSRLSKVYYAGTAEQWTAISIDHDNTPLTSATVYYYADTQPIGGGNYWHYVDGVPTEWPELFYSEGLEFVSNDDGTCYVAGIGECADTDIVIPTISPAGDSVTGIADSAFYECTSLTSVLIPSSVTSVGMYAFEYCTSLTTITIPDSVTSLGYGAFYECSSLVNVIIGSGITYIDAETFYGCRSLESIVFSDAVTSIGYRAFAYCDSLTNLTFGINITNIDGGAFADCYRLESIYYAGSEDDWYNNVSIWDDNEPLLYATMHYNYSPSTQI
jgi:hypothetical protein